MIKEFFKELFPGFNDPFGRYPSPDAAPRALTTADASTLRKECAARAEYADDKMRHLQAHLEDIARDTFSTLTHANKAMEERLNGYAEQMAELEARVDNLERPKPGGTKAKLTAVA